MEPAGDFGPEVRPLSFGLGDKSSPRVSPSGDRVAFVLDGYVVEKPLYTQDFRSRTASDFGAEGAEWLIDGSLAILGPKEETEDREAKTAPTPSTLFAARPDDSSNVSKLIEKIGAVGTVTGSQAFVAAVPTSPTPESPGEPPRSSLELLWGSEEPATVYLEGGIKGYVTGLSVSPDGRQAALGVRRGAAGRRKDRFEIQVYRFSEGPLRHVARVPKGMEVLGAPQWTPRGVYFVASKVNDPAKTARGGDPTTYALYRASEGSKVPEPVRSVGEDFVASSISVSPTIVTWPWWVTGTPAPQPTCTSWTSLRTP